MIVDRDDLQKQGARLFTKSKEFLNLGEVCIVPDRKQLRQELGARESGGFYICTIQKFCDRKDDKIGVINKRSNIICFSDEAHRTQLENAKKIQFSKDADDNMKLWCPSHMPRCCERRFRMRHLLALRVHRFQKHIRPSVMKLIVIPWIRLLLTALLYQLSIIPALQKCCLIKKK